ncbi:MAG: NAD(P)-dependent oxidoreductase [Phycisphaeraceae bacterium]|nr:NAD(P)-dependent oxidoreductase [Phycisphaeraceae bacterium]
MQDIGVIGMGTMGEPMSLNLIKNGFKVMVFNRTPSRGTRAAAAGAVVASSIKQVTQASEAIVVMVSDDEAVREVILGDEGIVQYAKRGQIVINSSTILPDTARQVAQTLREKSVIYLEAPVTGSRPQAEQGQLFFLVGGSRADYERCIPLFEAMGKKHLYLGGVGTGTCAKLANNIMGFTNFTALAEVLMLVKRFGLDVDLFVEVVRNSGGRSAVFDAKCAKLLQRDWRPEFALGNAAKDMRLAQQLTRTLSVDAPVIAAAQKVYDAASRVCDPSDDMCSLIKFYERPGSS